MDDKWHKVLHEQQAKDLEAIKKRQLVIIIAIAASIGAPFAEQLLKLQGA